MPFSSRQCLMCSAEYTPTGSHQKVCASCTPAFRKAKNIDHQRALRAARGAIVIGTIIQCATCGDDFPYSSGPQRRCAECQRKREVEQVHEALRKSPKAAAYRRRAKDNYSFGGNRQAALERDNHTCQRCGAVEDLHVHHMDGKGVTTPRPHRNNALDNLQTLCRACHSFVHQEERRASHQATSAKSEASGSAEL